MKPIRQRASRHWSHDAGNTTSDRTETSVEVRSWTVASAELAMLPRLPDTADELKSNVDHLPWS